MASLKSLTKMKGFFGIKSASDLATLTYSVAGVSLASDKLINVLNVAGSSFAKPLIAGLIAYVFPFKKESRLIFTLLSVVVALGFGFGSMGRLGGGLAQKGFGVYGQRQGTDTPNVLGRLP
jgi:apolipoprotein N-acyltransferase|tara:strand:- start:300 stop:662 length:363 start_codon:yes stop_codon:yes gene_type:complete